MTSISDPEATYLGLDVHKDTISVGVLESGSDAPAVDKIFHDEPSVRRLVGRFRDAGRLRACYEAGPTGYELHRLLTSMGVACEVIAPSLIPTAPGDRVKTDKRDCRRLARLYRARQLVAIRVPSVTEEAVRDLCRARADLVDDRDRARKRLNAFLLRHARIYRLGSRWTHRHEQWLAAQRFDERALTETFSHYRAVLAAREAAVAAVDADLKPWFDRAPFVDAVHRLGAYRGIGHLGALTLASEVCDWRRFPRAGAFMGFVGLVPSEYSSGGSTRRGHLTKAGNAHLRSQLVESAWSYQHRPAVGLELRRRQEGLDREVIARAWKAQTRLCGRFRRMAQVKHTKPVVLRRAEVPTRERASGEGLAAGASSSASATIRSGARPTAAAEARQRGRAAIAHARRRAMKIYTGPAELLDASGQTVAEIEVELHVHDTGSAPRGWGGPFELTRILGDTSDTARIRLPDSSEAVASCQSQGWLQGSGEPPDLH